MPPKMSPWFSRSTWRVSLLFNDAIAMFSVTGSLHFFTKHSYLFANVLDALEEGPTKEFLSNDWGEKDVEKGVSPPLTTITNCLQKDE